MNISELYVPDYVEHISDWRDYQIPLGHCIVDKTICGCGYTEYCLRPENPDNIILCSPRIVLLDNKSEKHKDDRNIYYYRSELIKDEFEKQYKCSGGKIPDRKTKLNPQEKLEYNKNRFEFSAALIRKHVNGCRTIGQPVRILCTYDSFHTIKEILKDVLSDFKVVVDEFQSIFMDSFFKANVENLFLEELQNVPNVTYLSATPMLEKYLEMLPEFQNLPYQKLIWPRKMVSTAKVRESWVSDVRAEILNIIDIYKNRPLERPFKKVNEKVIFSSEVVIYVNSVSMIADIIKKAKLEPSECNIIVANTPGNRSLVKNIRKASLPAGIRFSIGKVPQEDELNKMFTFCTRTAYLGADFYSTTAMTYVASDANIQSLMVDIRLDLPQIIGRQRLKENPWKNECVVFYKTLSDGKIISYEDFQRNVEQKINCTYNYIEDQYNLKHGTSKKAFIDGIFGNRIDGKFRTMEGELSSEICNSYSGLDREGNVVYNKFLEIADARAWELSQMDYNTNMSVLASIGDLDNTVVEKYESEEDEQAQRFITGLKAIKKFDEKLRLYCEFREGTKDKPRLTSRLLAYYSGTSNNLENFYSVFGLEGCRAQGFRFDRLSRMLNDEINKDSLTAVIYQSFALKETYSVKDIKNTLKAIYDSLGINKTPKATDLLEYYNVLERKMTDSVTKKRIASYQLISIK
jgi:hypothetical protein